jgi:two-component system chemotaxis response regulator CheY
MSDIGSKRILAVDDSRASLNIMKRLLRDSGFEVVGEARRGDEALSEYRRLSPDVVLLDIVMPDMDGVKVLEELRGLDPGACVVMFSSMGTPDKIRECTEKGAKGFVMKPCSREDLLRLLTQVSNQQAQDKTVRVEPS